MVEMSPVKMTVSLNKEHVELVLIALDVLNTLSENPYTQAYFVDFVEQANKFCGFNLDTNGILSNLHSYTDQHIGLALDALYEVHQGQYSFYDTSS